MGISRKGARTARTGVVEGQAEAATAAALPWAGRRLVGIFAHPDDESYGPAGTVARYAALGAEAHLICATRGEAGSMGPAAGYSPAALGAIRAGELRLAAQVIGYRTTRILGYPDGQVARVEPERVIGELAESLAELAADVVVTFHPLGISGHADHRAMTDFAAAAVARWRARRRQPVGLYYYTVPASVARQLEFRSMPLVDDAEIRVEIDTSQFAAVKQRAILCHRTQLAFHRQLRAVPGYRQRLSRELFTTEGPNGPVAGRATELLDDAAAARG